MSDALRVEEGAAPWAPAHDVIPGEVLDFYDVPRAGLLHHAGQTYYFQTILGDGQALGFWAYVHLTDDEVRDLVSAHGPDELDKVTERLLQNRWVTVAIAADDAIIDAAELDAGLEGAIGLAERMIQRWKKQRAAWESADRMVSASPT